MKSKLSAIVLIGSFLAIPAAAQQERAGRQLGMLDEFTGMYRQTIPIEVPPFHGLEPKLALAYASAGGNGFVGVGWDLTGFSMIQEPWGTSPKYYQLDGEPMIPCHASSRSPSCTAIKATYGSVSRGYTLLHDDNRRIRKIGGIDDLFWEVIEPDGTLSRYNDVWYGGAFGHRFLLSYKTDRHGNQVDYDWDCPTQPGPSGSTIYADCQPKQVTYNGVTVTFESEDRADTILFATGVTSSSTGVYMGLTTRRLSRIVVRSSGQLVREYQLTYRDDETDTSATRRSLLKQVVELGTDNPQAAGPRALPARTFTYSGMTPGSFGPGETTGPKEWDYCGDGTTEGSPMYPLIVGDFNGDRCADFFQGTLSANRPSITLSRCDGTANFRPYVIADLDGSNHYSMANPSMWRFGDFNGDGRTDFLQMELWGPEQVVHFYLANPTNANGDFVGFNHVPSFAVRLDNIWPDYGENDAQRLDTGDFNGDGLTDIAIIPHCSGDPYTPCNLPIKIKLARWMEWGVMFDDFNGPVGEFWNTSAAHELYAIRRYKYADFNGDGRTDILKIEGWETTPSTAEAVTIYYSTLETKGYTTTGTFAEHEHSGPKLPYDGYPFIVENGTLHDDTRLRFGDFNGDGMTDIAIVNGNVGYPAVPMSIHLSYGNDGAFSPSITGPLQRMYNTDQFYSTSWIPIADFNGDGRSDIGYHPSINGPLTIYLSLGFEASTLTFTNSIPAPSTWRFDCSRVADFTGDGLDDLADLQYYRDVRIHRMNAEVPDLLVRSDNGIGAYASIVYSPTTRFANQPGTPVQHVIKNLTIVDGNGGAATTTMTYKGGAYDSVADRFLGFASVIEKLPLAPSDQGIPAHRKSTFIQDANLPPSTEDKVEMFKGDPDAGGKLVQRIDYTYRNGNPSSPCLFEPPYSTLLTKIETREFDLTGIGCPESWPVGTTCAHGRRTLVEREYDLQASVPCPAPAQMWQGWKIGYGNVTKETLHGDPDLADGRDHTVSTSFPTTPNNANYVVDKPVSRVIRQGTSGTGAIAAQTNFFYDNTLPAGSDGSTGWDRSVSIGDLTSTSGWLNLESRWLVDRAEFDIYGNKTATIDPMGNRNETAYDTVFHIYPIRHTNAVSHVTQVTSFDYLCGKPIRELDVNGNETVHSYDALCRLRRSDLPGGGFKTLEYSLGTTADTRYTREAGPGANGGDLWSYSYFDGLGRTVKTKRRGPSASQDILTTTTYDARGRVSRVVAPYYAGGPVPNFTWTWYDVLGREVRVTLPDGTFRTFDHGYESGRYRVLLTDEESRQRKTFYDGFGNVAEIRESKGDGTWAAAQFVDRFDMTETIDPGGSRWTKLLDSLGRLYEERHPDKGTWNYDWWDNGLLKQTYDNSTPRKITYFEYDGIGRKIWKGTQIGTGFDSWVGWDYDWPLAGYANVGRLVVMYDNFGAESYRWDAAGNLAHKERQTSSTNYVFDYGYDTGNRLRWRTFPDGDTFGTATAPLQYDDAGRQSSGPGVFSGAAYTAWGAVSSFYNANGIVTVRTYDPARQWLTGVRSTHDYPMTCQSMNIPDNRCVVDWCGDQIYCGPGWFQCCQTPPTDVIQDLVYTRDGLGRVRQVTGTFPYESWSYDFDALGRLRQATSHTNAYYDQSWTYDDSGNITSNSALGTYLYNAPKPGGGVLPHAVSNVAGTTYTYDANGNMTGGRLGTLTWDGDGLPTAIGALRFHYDGNGRRLRSMRVGATSTLTWFVDNDYEVNQNVATKYFRLGDLLVGKRKAGATYWLHTDDLASVQAITDASGATVWRQQYHPYGEAFVGGYGHAESHAFTGERRDENGLIYLTARYYDPVLGRFISSDDRIGSEGIVGLNPYVYAANDPVNNTDHSGHVVETVYDVAMATISVKQAIEKPTFWNIAGAVLDVAAVVTPGAPAVGGRAIDAAQAGAKLGAFSWFKKAGEALEGALKAKFAGKAAETAEKGRTVIGKLADIEPHKLRPGENTLVKHMETDLGSDKANWLRNSEVLRTEMAKGMPIRDASVDPKTGALINNFGFLQAERNVLQNRGWTFDPKTRLWSPPVKK
jgi:RHS repeat-associated protein